MSILVILIPLLPLVGFLINGIGFKKINHFLASTISIAAVFIPFIVSGYLFLNFEKPEVIHLFDWIKVGNLNISMSLLVDQLSISMLLIITGIGSLIHLYSAGYMSHDEGFGKFMAFLNLFIFFMLLLVLGSNYVVMFIGWEGVGLCSYLLIGFWNKNNNYGTAARKAFIMNRIGDLGFLIGIFVTLQHFGTIDYIALKEAITTGNYSMGDHTLTIITGLFFIGAMGKSAQIPLYTWLPDAMAGPTPVSALIHAATMVTAGIYMIIRSNFMYSLAPETLHVVAWIGGATALLAASIGLFQNDIKKILAYSTVSQLGYMFMGLGVMAYSSSFFHVMTHAFFKALLFLGAGSVIHAMSNEQDIRQMGGLRKKLPITFITFLIGTIAISGIPPFSGFFSKDEILAHVYEHNPSLWALAILGSLMTSFYMFRVLFLTFFGEFRGTEKQKSHLHESPLSMTLPLMVLAVFAAIAGLFNLPHIFGGHSQLANFLSPLIISSQTESVSIDESLEIKLMGISVIIAIVSALAAYYIYVLQKRVPTQDNAIKGLQKLVYNKYYIDELYNNLFVKPIVWLSGFFHNIIDFLVIDFAVEGIGKITKYASSESRKIQNGTTGSYIFYMVIAIIALVAYSVWGLLPFSK